MVILDASVVNVALPTIKGDLGFSEQNLSWILNAYTLVFGGFLLLAGRAADRLGRRRLFIAGISLFSAASLICGLSQSAGMLLVARAAQGLGGAMVSPAALSIILATFAEGTKRNRALAIWGAIASSGGAVGLLLGGAIIQAISWRWVFFINVPIGAAVLALTPRIVPESRSEAVAKTGYDAEGAISITLGTVGLVFTLINANSWGWGSGKTIAGFSVSAVLIAAFVIIEQRHKDPLVPLRIFSDRSLAASDATFLLVAAGLFGMFFFCTLYLQQVLGYTALKTGVAYLLPAMVILGLGFGMSFVPATIAATSGVAREDSGLASGLLNTTQEVGGSLGLAILSTVSTTRVANALHGGAALPVALTHGFTGAFTVSGLLCAASVVLALVLLPRRKRAVKNEQVETIASSFARCPGAPYAGHLARLVAVTRRSGKPTANKDVGPSS